MDKVYGCQVRYHGCRPQSHFGTVEDTLDLGYRTFFFLFCLLNSFWLLYYICHYLCFVINFICPAILFFVCLCFYIKKYLSGNYYHSSDKPLIISLLGYLLDEQFSIEISWWLNVFKEKSNPSKSKSFKKGLKKFHS